ncbi:DUF4232 domain-containing protein [Winogradskya humida]|uniref:DUF4232 domain-containing protein n=1 Tax=Winogradskya humida TaxID=113566 RepID=UPI00194373D4|nr:DUF4232 domain-containing protein [Actinoplanes humidus]
MRTRWLVPVLVTAVLLAGCDVSPEDGRPLVLGSPAPAVPVPAAVSPSPAAVGDTGCLEPGVELSLSEVDGAMGLRAVGIQLRNCGTKPYVAYGYPLVDVLDADHRKLDVKVLVGTDNIQQVDTLKDTPERVEVAPGEQIGAALLWRSTNAPGEGDFMLGAYLSVAPAEGQPRHTLPLNVDLGTTGKMGVGPWE